MSTLGRVFGLAAALVFVSACGGGGSGDGGSGGGTQPTSFTVNTSVTGTGSGTISPTSRSVTQGNTTSFTVSAASGSTIASVTGCGGTLSGSTYTTGAITAACTVSANFSNSGGTPPPTAYTVSTAVSGSGSGSISPSSVNVIPGGSATFNLFPNSDSELSGVSGCAGTLAGNSYTTDAIDADCVVTATFDLKIYSVSTSVSGGGVISPGSASVQHGSSLALQILPDEGYEIESAEGCGGELTDSTFTTSAITGDCTVFAVFNLKTYEVTATASENGSISPPSLTVSHGDVATFTVIPDIGYQVESISGCGGSLNGNDYVTAAVSEACSVGVSFANIEADGRWDLRVIGMPSGYDEANVNRISGDGSTVLVAAYESGVGIPVAFRWSEARGFERLLLDGDHHSGATSVSFDGSTVVGTSLRFDGSRWTSRAFVWREEIGIEPLLLEGDSRSNDFFLSENGSIAWGTLCADESHGSCRSVIWTPEKGVEQLEFDNAVGIEVTASAPDGQAIGGSLCESRECFGFVWNRVTDLLERFKLDGLTGHRVLSLSNDGRAASGQSCGRDSPSSCRAFYWSNLAGIQEIHPADAGYSEGRHISGDGFTVLGETGSDHKAFIWTQVRGIEELILEGDALSQIMIWSLGRAISEDGNTAIGRSCRGPGQTGCRAFIWKPESGIKQVPEELEANGWSSPATMSMDGGAFIGNYSSGQEYGGFIWTREFGFESLPLRNLEAGLSADGTVIAGTLCNPVACELAMLTLRE